MLVAEELHFGRAATRLGIAYLEVTDLPPRPPWPSRGRRLDRAAHEAERADDVCGPGDPWDRGRVAVWLRLTGSTRSARGTLAEPHRALLAGDWATAARLWTEIGNPYDAALALTTASEEPPLRKALALFTDLAAAPAARIVRRKLRRLGARSLPVGPRTATRAHPSGLTARQQQVLELISTGHTNHEIAVRLFISAKTVDHHVGTILAKLGVPRRAAAAAEARRLGLVGTSTARS